MADFFLKDFTVSHFVVNKQNDVTKTMDEEKIQPVKENSTEVDDQDQNGSVLEVLFKNESFARKYRSKVEKFLKDLLEEGEKFTVYHPPNSYSEKEFSEEDLKTFCIDKFKNDLVEDNTQPVVPTYLSNYEDSLENINAVKEEAVKPAEEKQSLMTCFNCLGNHHLKECPDKKDYSRINMNKKDILMENTIRYHSDDDRSSLIPGNFSDKLREALGLQQNELPLFIYHMRVLGYPPGWLAEAVLEQSGLSMYDEDGKDTEKKSEPLNKGTFYDGNKFNEYPGFNTPAPHGTIDDWKSLKMPPAQDHQQLKQALRSPNIILSNNTYKRSFEMTGNEDSKRHKNVQKNSTDPSTFSSPKREPQECPPKLNSATPVQNQETKCLGLSISVTPGTPILKRGNLCEKLPGADKFAQGITEHLPFENLPDAVGSYDKMRCVINNVQKKLFSMKS